MHSPALGLVEMARVLVPGGHLLVSADSRWRLNHLLDPLFNPALKPLRRAVRRLASRHHSPQPAAQFELHSRKQVERWLDASGLRCEVWRSFGFLPLTLFGRKLLPSTADLAFHGRLQGLARRGVPGVRTVGAQYLFVARKQGGVGC